MMTAEERLRARVAAAATEFEAAAGAERRADWWRRFAANTTSRIPEGAALAGWDALLVGGPEERADAFELFERRRDTFVLVCNPHEAHDLGFRSEAADWAIPAESEDGSVADWPAVVVGLRWEVPRG